MAEPKARGDSIGRSRDSSLMVVKYTRPLVLVALGYMDPGNWATAIESGSRFGFELLWVVIISNVLALLFQTLAARLELVTGKHLAQICRDDYPQPVCTALWVLCQISVVALELTMVLGTAIGLNLLLGMPILPGVFLVVFDTLFFQLVVPLLGVQSVGFLTRTVLGVIVVCCVLDALLLSQPTAMVLAVGIWPTIRGETLYTAMALVGANVMPHTFYCHSPLAKRQQITGGGQSVETVCENSIRETTGAFGLVLVANVALLVVASTSFYNAGVVLLTLQDAHVLMEQVFSKSIAPAVFGLAMLCAGQSSTHDDGSSAGQAALEGFLETSRIHPWIHQLVVKATAITLAAFCAWDYGNEGLYQLLIFAQVILALLFPFTAIPLIKASASEARMGPFRMALLFEAVAWVSVSLVVAANVWLVFDVVFQEIDEFASFSAHLDQLLGTENPLSSYGSETMNAIVFALALVGIALCIGFLVWLVVTPLQIDRIAMERKWVEAYERFERNEVSRELQVGASESTNSDLMIQAPKFTGEFLRKRGMQQTRDDLYAWKVPLLQTSQINLLETSRSKIHELLQWPDVSQGVFRRVTFTDLDSGMKKAPDHQRIPEITGRSFEDLKPAEEEEPRFPLDKTKLLDIHSKVVEKAQELSRRYHGESSGSDKQEAEIFNVRGIVLQNLVCSDSFDSSTSAVMQDEILGEIDYSEDVVTAHPEPESQVLIESELERLGNSSGSSGEENPKCAAADSAAETTSAANTKTVAEIPPSAGQTAENDDVVCRADNCWESKGLKQAQMEVDAELLEKDDDEEEEADGWDSNDPEHHEGLVQVVDHASVIGGDLGPSSISSLTNCNSLNSIMSVEDTPRMTERSKGIGSMSGSGSLSQISGLGRAARRQFAVILDEFWSRLFDLHGQPIKGQSNAASSRMPGDGARGAMRLQQIDQSSTPLQSSSIESFNKDNKHGALLLKSQWSLQKKRSLSDQVGPMDAYMREHSHAVASTSSSFPVPPHEYSGRSENFSPYAIEQQYSSMYFPSSYSEETDKQYTTTARGPRSQSFVARSAVAAAAAHLDMQAFGSSFSLSGQALPQHTLGIGVERKKKKSYQVRLEEGYGGLVDSGPGSWDTLLESAALGPLVYRATGELARPTALNFPPVVRGRVLRSSDSRAPLSFDQISPSQSLKDGFSIQSGRIMENHSLWSRQPSEQIFGALDEVASGSNVRGGSVASAQHGKVSQFRTAVGSTEGVIIDSATTSSATGVDLELEVMESLRLCLGKLLQLDGSDWLFRRDNGSDQDLIAAVAAAEKSSLETLDSYNNQYYDSPVKHWMVPRSHPAAQSPLLVIKSSNKNESGRISRCGADSCVWGKGGLLISFGVWCMHRLLELSLMESRPELWGKYTYVLNRLQGILEPAFSNAQRVPASSLCSCFLERGSSVENLGTQVQLGVTLQQRILQQSVNADDPSYYRSSRTGAGVSIDAYACDPWAAHNSNSTTKSSKAKPGATMRAAIFLEMIKEVEAALGTRKGRTGTGAGDVAFPKGKENLASVLKRYKRRLANTSS